MNNILYNIKMRVENQTKTRVYAQKHLLKIPFKNSISVSVHSLNLMLRQKSGFIFPH
jgi:hypothetical protein